MSGIVSYGFYVPKFRIKTTEIARSWGKDSQQILNSLKVSEKAVAGQDEDSLTMAFSAAQNALNFDDIDRNQVKGVFFGSETPAYAVNPSSTIIADFLGIENNYYLAYDTQFACKAATGALVSALAYIEKNAPGYALVCGSDKANSKPADALEFTAASASVALLIGTEDVAVEIIDTLSYSSDTPDFWRRSGSNYPNHAGRFTGKPAYFTHVTNASTALLEKNNLKAEDFQYCVFHMPNSKFPVQVARSLGFEKHQYEDSLVVSYLGNSYSASSLMGLMAVLEKAKEGDKIFFCSYGSGAGSDAFIFEVTGNLEKRRQEFAKVVDQKEYIDYFTYRTFMEPSGHGF
ncbi:MAG: hydroxymethylglutaryl-CoA synthase [bacterium]